MISKKVCLIGSFAVGKTSLVRRFVQSCFDEKYQTTIGVKIDKKKLDIKGHQVQLIIWDLEGRDEFSELNATYLRGTSGYFLIADSTRRDTLEVAVDVQNKVIELIGDKPFVFLLSKTDLKDNRRIDKADIDELLSQGWPVLETSAKTGKNVEQAFTLLAERLTENHEVKAS